MEKMKQAELNKLLDLELRRSAKMHDWNCSRGFVFKATELLFLRILIVANVKPQRLSYSISYKLRAFDDLFGKIVKMEENPKRPLSFRAYGAWTFPMTKISEGELRIPDWDAEKLHIGINEIIGRCERDASDVAKEIQGLDDNLRVIERLYARHKLEYPNSVVSIWPERLLTSILKRQYLDSDRIVRDRIDSHDSGGFEVGHKSFFELAHEYLQSLEP
jgi:hypothetical protein